MNGTLLTQKILLRRYASVCCTMLLRSGYFRRAVGVSCRTLLYMVIVFKIDVNLFEYLM